MALNNFNWKTVIAIGLLSGLTQVAAGIVMYVAGVYFVFWSIFVGVFILLLCIVLGIRWYRDHELKGRITFGQALVVGIVIGVCTGVVYAIYNIISISFIYSSFLEDLIRLNLARMPAGQWTPEFAAELRQRLTANTIALGNLIRLSLMGTILSVFASLFLRADATLRLTAVRDGRPACTWS